MKAVFTGSLSDGFKIDSVADDATAEARAIALLADGRQIAEALEIKKPSDLVRHAEADPMGTIYVVYGKRLSNSFNLYGPLTNSDITHEFSEDDDNWEIFEAEAPKFLYTPLGRAWGHIFSGKSESMCRFVYDMKLEKLVCLGIFSNNRWQAASAAEMADVEDSLKNANKAVFDRPESFGLVQALPLPHWLDEEPRQRLLAKPATGTMKP